MATAEHRALRSARSAAGFLGVLESTVENADGSLTAVIQHYSGSDDHYIAEFSSAGSIRRLLESRAGVLTELPPQSILYGMIAELVGAASSHWQNSNISKTESEGL